MSSISFLLLVFDRLCFCNGHLVYMKLPFYHFLFDSRSMKCVVLTLEDESLTEMGSK